MSDDSNKQVIIIKIGSGVLAREEGAQLHHSMIARLVEAIAQINAAGHQPIIVSSGAVAAGLAAFDLDERPAPDDIGMLQACAAAGQARLMHAYENQFSNYGLKVAQILLTGDDLENERRRKNVHGTLSNLLRFPKVIPIINENDTVAVFELKVGDNDHLSSDVAHLLDVDLLILLTAVPGLRGPDSTGPDDIIEEVSDIESVMDFAKDEQGKFSVGGMRTKLEAVKKAVDSGIETVIASGLNPEQLGELVEGKGVGTRFLAK